MKRSRPIREGAGQSLYRRARQRIPGGTQLLSKRPELFLPGLWPAYFSAARGILVTDLDGNVYKDMGLMGVGAAVLGYADPDVDRAVKEAIDAGVASTLNCPEEVELADLLCDLHPWAGKVRYARSGGEAMSMAVRIARAATGRSKVAVGGYHGWCDWYLAANLENGAGLDDLLMPGLPPAGVPRELAGTALPFHYNRPDELKAIVQEHSGELAAVVMEPFRGTAPAHGFLETVRQLCRRAGAVLVFDEITTGFRAACGGVHLKLGVTPDIAVFAKGMANGYAMAAVIGEDRVMDAAQDGFISSTHWTERIGPAAALAAIRKFREKAVDEHIHRIGLEVQGGWASSAQDAGLEIACGEMPCLAHFSFLNLEEKEETAALTLFIQEMLRRGYLAFHQFKPSLAHTEQDADGYLAACREVFGEIAGALEKDDLHIRLEGEPLRRGFYRLT